MKTVKEMIEVMQAAERGEAIQCGNYTSKPIWQDYESGEYPTWDWPHVDYRIKPKPHTRPFTRADMTDEVRWLRCKDSLVALLVVDVNPDGLVAGNEYPKWASLAKDYEWSASCNGPWHPFTVEEP